ncbi:MAG TPA: YqeG family HAD IIIA-type phosphatase [Clostridiales bacterium]|nr:YqeG family HAD IIIA-type phosphatase [Clostridiales bacterium]
MLRRFYPKRLAESSYVINYEKLYQEGYRGILFDIDNTLVEHGADATPRAIQLFERLKKLGFQTCLISNNSKARVSRFNEKIGTNYIYKANKPFKKNYLRAVKIMGTRIDNTVFVGDQLFTDIYGANNIGMMTYLVNPIHPKEEIQIILKRKLERIVLYHYRKERSKGKIK